MKLASFSFSHRESPQALANGLRHDLHFSSIDSFLSSVMVGAGETFLPAFALAMGLSQATSGMMASLPFLAGSALQLLAPKGVERIGSYRKWLVTLGLVQALSFLPISLMAIYGKGMSAWVLFLVVTLYWAAGLASGPAWNSWICSLVPSRIRPRYFAKRNRHGQFGLLFGLMAGGVLLHFAKSGGWEMEAFAGLFIISGLSRVASAYCLGRQSEEPAMVQSQRSVPVMDVIKRLRKGSDGRVIGFLLLFAVAVNFAGPFFNPFMLTQLKLSYAPYMWLIAATLLSKIIAFKWLADRAQKMSPYSLMRVGIIGTALLPTLWIFSSQYAYLLGVQLASGVVGAVYDLGVTLVLFGAVRDEERTSFLSYYSFASALMVLAGSLCGAEILGFFGESMTTYFLIFGLSTAGRLLSLIYFDRVSDEIQGSVRQRQEASDAAVGTRAGLGRKRQNASRKAESA